MSTIGRNAAMGFVGFGVAVACGFLTDADVLAREVGMVVVVGGIAMMAFAGYRASAATPREISIPFVGTELPTPQVKVALERMGCVVEAESSNEVRGLVSEWGWGQVVTVTAEPGRLRVRSSFSDTRAWGAEKNQVNVERFRAEWERRAEVEAAAADPEVRAASEDKARKTARSTMWGSGFSVVLGVGALTLALFAPTRNGASPRSKYMLAGLGIMSFGAGLRGFKAAARRLREPPHR